MLDAFWGSPYAPAAAIAAFTAAIIACYIKFVYTKGEKLGR
jgi:hypothetical protein